jgi:hypothetical protein
LKDAIWKHLKKTLLKCGRDIYSKLLALWPSSAGIPASKTPNKMGSPLWNEYPQFSRYSHSKAVMDRLDFSYGSRHTHHN